MTSDGTTPSGNWPTTSRSGISDDQIAMTGQMALLSGGNYLLPEGWCGRLTARPPHCGPETSRGLDFVNWAPPRAATTATRPVTIGCSNPTAGDNDLVFMCPSRRGGDRDVHDHLARGRRRPCQQFACSRLRPARDARGERGCRRAARRACPRTTAARLTFTCATACSRARGNESVRPGGPVSAIRLFQLRMSDFRGRHRRDVRGEWRYRTTCRHRGLGRHDLPGFRLLERRRRVPVGVLDTGKRRGDATAAVERCVVQRRRLAHAQSR